MSTVPKRSWRGTWASKCSASRASQHGRGISDEPINHEEVMATGDRVRETFANCCDE
jgi:hypothetical protein